MPVRSLFLYTALLISIFGHPALCLSDTVLLKSGASQILRPSASCVGDVHLLLETPYRDFFTGTLRAQERSRLLASLKIAVPDVCPSAQRARITGLAVGRYIFEGCAERENGWSVRTLKIAPTGLSLTSSDELEVTMACKLDPNTIRYPSAFFRIRDDIASWRSSDCEQQLSSKFGGSPRDFGDLCQSMRQIFAQ